jgi:hypothetical protein
MSFSITKETALLVVTIKLFPMENVSASVDLH